jgi:hypothetical protein
MDRVKAPTIRTESTGKRVKWRVVRNLTPLRSNISPSHARRKKSASEQKTLCILDGSSLCDENLKYCEVDVDLIRNEFMGRRTFTGYVPEFYASKSGQTLKMSEYGY